MKQEDPHRHKAVPVQVLCYLKSKLASSVGEEKCESWLRQTGFVAKGEARQIRCDGERVCASCQKRGLTCEYVNRDTPGRLVFPTGHLLRETPARSLED